MYINKLPLFTAEPQNPYFLQNWREYEYSLTDKLIAAKGKADIELVFQNWIAPNWWDNHILNVHDKSVFQREIIMRNKGQAYWYARTIIPQKCYNLNPVFFNRLENESIRNLIFGESKVHRVNMICYPVDNQCIEFYWVKKYINTIEGILWVRLGEFSLIHRESFYLVEILFPELEYVS